ncbi:hypothetical protein F2Q70_00026504 [Brassica cretica]|uniref:Uncharacterized protein n=1 Tax=Brassica cretica TaxID=69181 RepID=A0A8S9L479_BRACR|nr:hypothetical protein F2Q68_00026074 [Brassica cretica]KAF2602094.1 hypothetical protein F2Q70_00026504 [Brassica cretica]
MLSRYGLSLSPVSSLTQASTIVRHSTHDSSLIATLPLPPITSLLWIYYKKACSLQKKIITSIFSVISYQTFSLFIVLQIFRASHGFGDSCLAQQQWQLRWRLLRGSTAAGSCSGGAPKSSTETRREGNHGPGDDMHGTTSLSTSVCVGGDEQEKEPTLETTSVRLINSGHIIFQVHLEAHIAKAHIE